MGSIENSAKDIENCQTSSMQNEDCNNTIESNRCEIIRLNNELISINQSQIKKIVRNVLQCDDLLDICRQFSELCLQYEHIWIKVSIINHCLK